MKKIKPSYNIFLCFLLTTFVLYCLFHFQKSKKTDRKYSQLSMSGTYFIPVSIAGFHRQIPFIEVELEDERNRVKIDLGFDRAINLSPSIIESLQHKSFIQRRSFYGIRGKKYETNVYSIPKLRIGKMSFIEPKIEEVNQEFKKDAVLMGNDTSFSEIQGYIGWPLFHNVNFFLDCQGSLLAFCDSLETLGKQGYPIESFIEVPLLLDRGILEFESMTELGPLRCALDTGSTWNILNKNLEGTTNAHMILDPMNMERQNALNPENIDLLEFDPEGICALSSFILKTTDFGPIEFQRLQTPLEIDAIIGMEFLESKLLFIDFPHRKIYFADPKKHFVKHRPTLPR